MFQDYVCGMDKITRLSKIQMSGAINTSRTKDSNTSKLISKIKKCHCTRHPYYKHNKAKYIDGIVQDCSNSSVLAMELPQSCTKPSIYFSSNMMIHRRLATTALWCIYLFMIPNARIAKIRKSIDDRDPWYSRNRHVHDMILGSGSAFYQHMYILYINSLVARFNATV